MGDTTVRSYTRNGRTVRSYSRRQDGSNWEPASRTGEPGPGDTDPDDSEAHRKKRERFEKRVQRERTGRRSPAEKKQKRAAGERKKRKKSSAQRARHHARRARRLYRRHKWKALGHLGMAGFWGAAHGTRKLRRRA